MRVSKSVKHYGKADMIRKYVCSPVAWIRNILLIFLFASIMIDGLSLPFFWLSASNGLELTAQAQLCEVPNRADGQTNERSFSLGPSSNSNSSTPFIGVNMRGYFTTHVQTKNVSSSPFPIDYYDDSFRALHEAGMNHIRYVYRWESYEKDPDSFINEIVTVAQTASKWGIKILYDNHQFHTSSWLNNKRGSGFPVSLFENNPQYGFNSGGGPGRETAKIWWTNWWNRNVSDGAGNDGWTLQAEFLKKIVQAVDGYPSTLGYEILNEPQVHSSGDWEKIGKYNTFMANELRKVTQKTLFYSMHIPIGLNVEHLQVNPENVAKMAPENKTNVVFKISLYGLPTPDGRDQRSRAFKIFGQAGEIAGVPLYVGEWGNVEREKITNEENVTEWEVSPEKSDINQTQAVNFVQRFKELGVLGWAYWIWDYKGQRLENFQLSNVTADNRIAPTKYFEYLKNAVAQVYRNTSTIVGNNSSGSAIKNTTISPCGEGLFPFLLTTVVDGKGYTVSGRANVKVSSFSFDPDNQTIDLGLEPQVEDAVQAKNQTIIELTIPYRVLEEVFSIKSGSDTLLPFDEISNSSSSTTIRIAVPAGIEKIAVLPEFSSTMVISILSLSIALFLNLLVKTRKKSQSNLY